MVGKKCPNCKSDILKAHGPEVKCRAKIIKWNEDGMFAICKVCGVDVPISNAEVKVVEEYVQNNS